MTSIRPMQITLLLCLASSCLLADADDDWKSVHFQAFAGVPKEHGIASIEMEYSEGGISELAKRDIEAALHDAAVWYKGHGFPGPALETIVSTDDGDAYRVYVCSKNHRACNGGVAPRNAAEAKYFAGGCPQSSGRTRYITYSQEAVLDSHGRLSEKGYQTVAHEFFHAIWYATRASKSDTACRSGNWILEGLADATAWDIAEEKWDGLMYPASTSDREIGKRWGTRTYHHRLPQAECKMMPIPNDPTDEYCFPMGYRTSSFWRFLANTHPRGWKVMVSGKGGAKGLLDFTFVNPRNLNWRHEVRWLDDGLRKRFNYGLNAMYAAFVTFYAYSVPPYTDFFNNLDEPGVMDKWTETLFEPCASVDLSGATTQKVNLKIDRLAARCLWVKSTGGQGAMQVTFQAGHDEYKLLDDIWISMPGTTLLVRASEVGHFDNGPYRYLATWKDFDQDASKRQLYLVTNISKQPSQSEPREFELVVSIPGGGNSFVGPLPPRNFVPTPEKPEHKKHADTLQKRISDTQKRLVDQAHEDKETPRPDMSSGTRIRRDPDKRECRNPFKYSPCGPQMHISLSVLPGTYLAPSQVSTIGGTTTQFMGAGLATGRTRLSSSHEEQQAVQGVINAIDGSQINISTPFFDYGFTGTFDSAKIRVRMADGSHHEAFGPPDQSGQMPLTGRVTIEEYSPFVISGHYSAQLAEMVPVPGRNPVYQARDTINGTFTSVAPWVADERKQRITQDKDEAFDELMNSIGISPALIRSVGGQPETQGSSTGSGPGSGAGSGEGSGEDYGGCSCKCEDRAFADELCELFCEEEFAACE
ncbi:MAG TPA: hypothetical protein VJ984_02530 [Xanthomonadales bacterium]|nr:hypothetical protein [Xanthomonadales bacterium]